MGASSPQKHDPIGNGRGRSSGSAARARKRSKIPAATAPASPSAGAADPVRDWRGVAAEAMVVAALLDANGVVLEIDGDLPRSNGYATKDLRGRRFEECDWWGDWRTVVAQACAEASGGAAVHRAAACTPADGPSRAIQLQVTPVRDAQGQVIQLVALGMECNQVLLPDPPPRVSAQTRFRTMANMTPAIIWTASPGGSMTWASDRWFEYTGMSRRDNARSWSRVLHPEDAQRALDAWNKALTEGSQYEVEVRNRGRDGEYRWFVTRATPVRDIDGRIVEWCGSSMDVHDLKLAQQARARLAAIVESTDDAVISKTLEGIITSWNPGAEHIFGYSAEEMIGQSVRRLIPPELQDEEDTIIARIRSGQPVDHYETVRVTSDGRRLDISLTISPMRDERGEIIGACKVARDITAKKQIERALQESEQHIRAVINGLPAAVYTTDPAGRITHYNHAATELSGREPETGSDRWCVTWKLFHPDVTPMPHSQCPMAAALRGEDVTRGSEIIAERPDGSRLWLAAYPTPLYDEAGRITGGINMLVDITQRKRDEQILARRAAEQTALYRFTDRLHRAESEQDIFDAALDAMRSAMGCDRASVLLYDADQVMRFAAWTGLSEAYRRAVEGHSPWTADAVDPQPVAVADVSQAPIDDDLKQVVLREGIQALVFVPLVSEGRLIGKFMAYHDALHEFSSEELSLAMLISRQLTFAIRRVRSEVSRQRAEQALRASEAQNRAIADRLTILLKTTSHLIETLETHELLEWLLDLAREMVSADAFGIWRRSDDECWSLVSSNGLSDEFIADALSGSPAIPSEPIVVQPDDLQHRTIPLLSRRWERYEKEGIRSLLVLPLRIHGQPSGSLVFYCRSAHEFSDVEVESAQALANIAAAAITTSELYETQSRLRERAEESAVREGFLAAAGKVLAESLDFEQTLVNIAQAAVPYFGDWCSVDLLDEHGHLKRLSIAHVDPNRVAEAKRLREQYPPDENAPNGVHHVVRTGEPELVSEIPDELLVRAARDETHLRLLRDLHLTSYICVPLRVAGRVVGAMTFVTTESGRHFQRRDLALALEIAARAEQALDNARLYRALSDNEQRLRLALDAGRMGTWEWFIDTSEVKWSPGLELLHGLEVGAFPGTFEAFQRDVHPDDRDMVRQTIERTLSTRQEYRIEYRIIWPDGSIHWVEGRGKLFADEDGSPRRMIGVCADITDRRRADEARVESERRYRQLLALLPVAVYSCEAPSGMISYYNDQAATNWGRRPKVGDSDERFCGSFKLRRPDGSILPHDQTPMAVALREGRAFRNEDVIIERPDGSRIDVLVNIDPLRDADGRIVGAINAFQDVSMRRHAERALRESERRFRLMADAAPVLIWVSDERKRGVYFNEGWLSFTGRTLEQEMGDGWLENIHPEDVEATARTCRGAYEKREPFRIEFRMRRADGQYRWLLDHGVPRFTEDGQLSGYIGSCIDVTDHKRAEAALRHSEERFRELANHMDQFAWTCDHLGAATWYNQRWYEYTGTTFDEMRGWGWTKVHHPDHRDRVIKHLKRCFDAGESWEDVFPLRGRDGEYRWFLSRALPICDEHGKVLRWFGTNTDITAQREAEQALRESERRLSTLISNLPGMAYRCRNESEWPIEFISDGVADITGYDSSQFGRGGRSWDSVIHPEDLDAVWKHIYAGIRDRRPFQMEYRIRHKDGAVRWVWEQGQAIFAEGAYEPEALEGFVTDITERKRTEEQLRERDERFNLMANGAPVLIWISGTDKGCTWFNRPWLEFVGRSLEQELGDGWMQNVHPDDLDRCLETYTSAFDGRKAFSMEYRLRRHDGQYRWMLDAGIPIYGVNAEFTGYIGSCIDISERRQMEASLRTKEAELELIATATPVILTRCSRDLRYLFMNHAGASLLGGNPEEVVGRPIAEVLGPEAFEMIRPYVERVLTGEPVQYELEIAYPGSGPRCVHVNYVPDRNENGEVVGWIASIIDITGRKRVEEALRASEARYRAVVHTAMDCIFTMEGDGRITAFNPAAERLFGYDRHEIIGRNLEDVILPASQRSAHRAKLDQLLSDDQAVQQGVRLEMPAVRKDGQHLLVELSMSRMPGHPPSFTGFLRDITEQKNAELAMKRSREELERRVAERTVELQQRADQLARLTSELTLTERRERQRLARLLHDHLQQLLASGKLGLGFISDNGEQRQKEWIEHIRSCINEAIEAARTLSVELCPPVLHEGGLAAGCEWLARRMKDQHGLVVDLSLDDAANPEREDVRTLIFECIRELLFNAVKHSNVHRVSLELAREGDEWLRVVISDEGAGFDADSVFDSSEHSGFGLFSIRERLMHLGGRFEVLSSVGHGARFTLVAPRLAASQRPPSVPPGEVKVASPPVTIPPVPPARRHSNRTRILVVDDHAVMREGVCALLAEHPGLEVVGEASDGLEAVEKARALQPDVVLMDFSLPSINGAQATRRIVDDLPDTRVIGLSMYKASEGADALLEAGAVAYVNKSDDAQTLIETICRSSPHLEATSP